MILCIKNFFIFIKYSSVTAMQSEVNVGKSVVRTMGFTAEDKHFIKWLWASEQYEPKHFRRMFPNRG